jgi:hypothetical protein
LVMGCFENSGYSIFTTPHSPVIARRSRASSGRDFGD